MPRWTLPPHLYVYIYIYILFFIIFIFYFFSKFSCHEIQLQNGQASRRQSHLRPTEKAASPGKKDKQQLSLQFRINSF